MVKIFLLVSAVAGAESSLETIPCFGSASFLGLPRTNVDSSRDWSNQLKLCRRHEKNSEDEDCHRKFHTSSGCCTPDMTESLRLKLRPTANRQISQTLFGLEANAQEHWQRGLSVGCQVSQYYQPILMC